MLIFCDFLLFGWGSDDDVVEIVHFSLVNGDFLDIVHFDDVLGGGFSVSINSDVDPEVCVIGENTIDTEIVRTVGDNLKAVVFLFNVL